MKRRTGGARSIDYMMPMYARAAIAITGLALAATVAPVRAAAGCSSDAFTVTGTSLAVEICAPATRGPGKAPVLATATLTARGKDAVVRKIPLDVVSDEASHTIDDAPLQSLGIAGTLHMTIGYKAGAVRLEHALLVPGAIALK